MNKKQTQNSVSTALSKLKKDYDNEVRKFLSEKSVLAVILKDCLPEFANCTDKEIIEKYISGEPEVGTVGVDRDTPRSGKVRALANEDISVDDGYVRYDIHFRVILPDTTETIEMIVNIEAQRKFHPGYPIVKRAMYYAARLLSSQKNTDFIGSNYGKLKKVSTILICYNVPKYMKNTILSYRMQEQFIARNQNSKRQKRENYDLLSVILIGLGDQNQAGNYRTLRMLTTAMSNQIDVKTKKEILENEIGIPMTEIVDRKVENMCNISSGVYAEGRKEGRNEGHKEGFKEGRREGRINDLRSIMKKMGMTVEQAMDMLDIPQIERADYLKALA